MSESTTGEIALSCIDASTPAESPLASAEHAALAAAAIAAASRSETAPSAISETDAPDTGRKLAELYDEMMERHKPSHSVQIENYNKISDAMRAFQHAVTLREVPREDLRILNEDASSSFKNGDAVLKRGTPTWHLANWLRRDHGVLCSIVRKDETLGTLLSKRTVFTYKLVATWTQWADARASGSTAAAAMLERNKSKAEVERLERRIRELETEKATLEGELRTLEHAFAQARVAHLEEQRSVAPTPIVEDGLDAN